MFYNRICGKRFSQRPNMRAHELTHSIHKQFKCSLCSKLFCNKKQLQRHMVCFISWNLIESFFIVTLFKANQVQTYNKSLKILLTSLYLNVFLGLILFTLAISLFSVKFMEQSFYNILSFFFNCCS